jgi:ribosomal protein L6P/L9E
MLVSERLVAEIRSIHPPEPYKRGKGIKYTELRFDAQSW